jgi:hypothetical protein
MTSSFREAIMKNHVLCTVSAAHFAVSLALKGMLPGLGCIMTRAAAIFKGHANTVASKGLTKILPRKGFITVKDAFYVP